MRRTHTGNLARRAADILWLLAEADQTDAPDWLRCQAREMARVLECGTVFYGIFAVKK